MGRRADTPIGEKPVVSVESVIVYECPSCEERVAVRRCPDCHVFCRRVGPGGRCPGCGEMVLVAELEGDG